MRTRSKLLLAGFTATLVLAATVGSATAGHLSVSNRNFRAVWTSLEAITSSGILRCPITVEGSFHSATAGKVAGALLGNVSRGTIVGANCTNGTATVNQEALPWHITYESFTGVLPEISGIRLKLVGAKFTTRIGGLGCTIQTSVGSPARAIAQLEEAEGGGAVVTSVRTDETARIPLRSAFLCEIGGEGSDSGTASVTLLGSATRITVTLI
jgi:hypothetical protein